MEQSEVLGEWSESHWTPQIVPLSPAQSLVENKSQVFLAHPTAEDHGFAMAEYAWDTLQLNRVAIWTDQRKFETCLGRSSRILCRKNRPNGPR